MMKVTIPRDRINECIERMCEDYCTWPDICETQERLSMHCQECPLNNLLIDEYWERKEDV